MRIDRFEDIERGFINYLTDYEQQHKQRRARKTVNLEP